MTVFIPNWLKWPEKLHNALPDYLLCINALLIQHTVDHTTWNTKIKSLDRKMIIS